MAKELIDDINEYLKNPTAFQAERWLKGDRNSDAEPISVSDEELTALYKETSSLSQSVKSSILKDGIHLGRRRVEEEAGGLKAIGFRQEVFLRPDVAPKITGNEQVETVQYLQNPQWKDVNYGARLLIRLKGEDPLVVAFERSGISRVKERVSVQPDRFGFKFSGVEHEATRYPLTAQESRLVRNTLAGINTHLRDMQLARI